MKQNYHGLSNNCIALLSYLNNFNLQKKYSNLSSPISSGGFVNSLTLRLTFKNSPLSKQQVKIKAQGCVDYYAKQSTQVYSAVPPGFKYEKINPNAIKASCLVDRLVG